MHLHMVQPAVPDDRKRLVVVGVMCFNALFPAYDTRLLRERPTPDMILDPVAGSDLLWVPSLGASQALAAFVGVGPGSLMGCDTIEVSA